MTENTPLDRHLAWLTALPDGWHRLFRRLAVQLAIDDRDVVILQAREKFGRMDIVTQGGNGKAAAIIRIASAASGRTCQTCGRPALLARRIQGIIYATLCEDHAGERCMAFVTEQQTLPDLSDTDGGANSPGVDPVLAQACRDRPDLLAFFLPAGANKRLPVGDPYRTSPPR